jgi:hypothetical protein
MTTRQQNHGKPWQQHDKAMTRETPNGKNMPVPKRQQK